LTVFTCVIILCSWFVPGLFLIVLIKGRHPQLLDGCSSVSWFVPGLVHSVALVLRVTCYWGLECSLWQFVAWFKSRGSGCCVLGEFFMLSGVRSSCCGFFV
jgi:hypothetical protein